jgi:peptide/nickel transport system substrate-binding protein
VRSDDVIASLRRWCERDVMGQRLLANAEAMEAIDAKSFRIRLKAPFDVMLQTLGKPSNAPFIMPRRVAETPADKQLDDTTGSGPFIFSKEDWRPGEKVVYLRNVKYRPRTEPPSGLSGAKIAKVDRVEWVIIKDPQTQVNALVAGEVDVIDNPAFESYASLKGNPDILLEKSPVRRQVVLRFNHLQPPFDKPQIRRAAMLALDQDSMLRAQVGDRERYNPCASIYPCGSALATTKGMEHLARRDVMSARAQLAAVGYDGAPAVVMQPTDAAVISKYPVMAAQLLRQAGFKIDLQAMDWQTLVSRRARKDLPSRGGWSILVTNFPVFDVADPVAHIVAGAGCDKAWFGWPCDAEIERLRDEYARAAGDEQRKALAERLQIRALELGVYAPMGEVTIPRAYRKSVRGLIEGFYFVAWNAEKQ